MVIWAVSLLLSGLAILLFVKLRAMKSAKRAMAKQQSPPPLPRLDPTTDINTPILHGVRVLDLSTVVAVPTLGRILAELGAEVVKVEEPSGDMFRDLFLEYEQPRNHASVFDFANLSKRGIQLDLKTKADIANFHKLLADCDVLITNVRIDGLKRLGLDYSTLSQSYPHLVYAHVSAWGNEGSSYHRPGYDLGSFWASTGMASQVQPEGMFAVYPLAFGDTATGSIALAGIAALLKRRITTGRGGYVDSALFRNGLWCLMPHLMNETVQKAPSFPDYSHRTKCASVGHDFDNSSKYGSNPLYATYSSKDGHSFGILALEKVEEYMEKISHLGNNRRQLEKRFENMQMDDIHRELERHGIPHTVCPRIIEVVEHLRGGKVAVDLIHKKCGSVLDQVPPEITDMIGIPKIPFDFGCSSKHGVQGPAPGKGAHTTHYLREGWSKRHPNAEILKSSNGLVKDSVLPLDGMKILEWTAGGFEVSAATVQLVELGAKVLRIDDVSAERWQSRNPPLFVNLNRMKEDIEVDMSKDSGNAVLLEQLAHVDAFATNIPYSRLRKSGLDYDSLKKKFPQLVYVITTPCGLDGPENIRGDLGVFWMQSGIGSMIAGGSSSPSNLPAHLGDLFTSFYVAPAIVTALFHRVRTGRGQLAHLSLLRVATWSVGALLSVAIKDPLKLELVLVPIDRIKSNFPVPTANAVRTEDGLWIQLLGVDLKKHIHRTVTTLSPPPLSFYSELLYTILFKVIPNDGKGCAMLKFLPMLQFMNNAFLRGASRNNARELKALMDKAGMWYTDCVEPAQVLRDEHSFACGALSKQPDGSVKVVPPLKLIIS